ncbi:hypothetical protein GGR56DRAFT_622087 [Xylariaceae sp. FL0804]|nr:hypothetical protein GGR56DRAFT_622087 [Xylariaceae sp. FL0804]
MLQASKSPYTCWRCASRRLRHGLAPRPARLSPASAVMVRPHSRRTLATVQQSPADYELSRQQPEEHVPIRERLRQWDSNDPVKNSLDELDIPDFNAPNNSITRSMQIVPAVDKVPEPVFEGDELGDLRAADEELGLGDLVELFSYADRRPLLAVCLGRVNGYQSYYTSSGKWLVAWGVVPSFALRGFCEPAEMKDILGAVPVGETPLESVNSLQDLGYNPSRATGAALLQKMLHFSQDVETVYRSNASVLDAAGSLIRHPVKRQYLTLHEIAERLLPESQKRGASYNPGALYAVHRAIMLDPVHFAPLNRKTHLRTYLFEISSQRDGLVVQKVQQIVRAHTSGDFASSTLEKFITTARRSIDRSRETRRWSDSGMVGPSSGATPTPPEWSPADLDIIHFIELWAAYAKLPPSSPLQAVGSSILRLTDRYGDAKSLGPDTGWTFLKEIGWIPNWEIRTRYSERLPEVEVKRSGGYARPPLPAPIEAHLERDTLSLVRQDLDGVVAYCIDDLSASEIDDAVSLERTSEPDQYWIHTHVSDPTSSIPHGTPLAKHAELLPLTIYLTGHFEPMLPESLVQERFSLGPDKPCLTFSALVKTDGTVLDHKITPGRLREVKYMTYEDAALAIQETRDDPEFEGTDQVMNIGAVPEPGQVKRKMTRPADLTNEQKDDLTLLSQLGKALQARRLERGAVPVFPPSPMPTFHFHNVERNEANRPASIAGDPSVSIKYSGNATSDLVQNVMLLGNEVAARWCFERGIPIPYRTQPTSLRNAAELQQYSRDVINPLLLAGVRPSPAQMKRLIGLRGVDVISTTPTPYTTLGVDMYTKATSPLRRFSDMIVHWQIAAAILEEHRLGRSLVVQQPTATAEAAGEAEEGDRLSFLPYSREELKRMFPLLRLRESQAGVLSQRFGHEQTLLQALVRAWEFGQDLGGQQLPETFRFRVTFMRGKRLVEGKLNWFHQQATILPEDFNVALADGRRLRMADVRVGDVFEVRLKNISLYYNRVHVETVDLISRAEDGDGDGDGAVLARSNNESGRRVGGVAMGG